MTYSTDLTPDQTKYILANFPEILKTKSKDDVVAIFNGLLYLVKTGCQWSMLPKSYPKWRKVYNFYRRWHDTGLFSRMMRALNARARASKGRAACPTAAVIDSESSRSGLPHSDKGIDGGKKVKGIKRHVAVDSEGFPLAVSVTKANTHDSKAAYRLVCEAITNYPSIRLIKADNGYRGALPTLLRAHCSVEMLCVKSNFGTPEFRPIGGRWVVERTFSWLSALRRMCRNYEQHLHTAKAMAEAACVAFMLRYI